MTEDGNGDVPEKWSHLPVDEQKRRMAARERALKNPAFVENMGDKEVLEKGREIGQEVSAFNRTGRGKRLQKFLAEQARDEDRQQKILAVIDDSIDPKKDVPMYLRFEGIKLLVGFEEREHERDIHRKEREEDRDKDEIIRALATRLFRLQELSGVSFVRDPIGRGDREIAGELEPGRNSGADE